MNDLSRVNPRAIGEEAWRRLAADPLTVLSEDEMDAEREAALDLDPPIPDVPNDPYPLHPDDPQPTEDPEP